MVLSAGFGGGPLAAGLLAQFLPAPQVTPFLLHVLLAGCAAVLVWRVPETQPPASGPRPSRPLVPAVARTGRFFWVVAAWAPWVFGTATIAFASIPSFLLTTCASPWPTSARWPPR